MTFSMSEHSRIPESHFPGCHGPEAAKPNSRTVEPLGVYTGGVRCLTCPYLSRAPARGPVPLTDCGRSTLAQARRSGIYIDWYGVKSWTGPSASFARNSALTSPRTSP